MYRILTNLVRLNLSLEREREREREEEAEAGVVLECEFSAISPKQATIA